MRVLLVVVIACQQSGAPADRTPVATPADHPPVTAPADARGPAAADARVLVAVAGDPPEPTAPVVECNFERSVYCVPPLANHRPYQRPPFEGCPATRPPMVKDAVFPDAQSQFSAAETRAVWAFAPGMCCYVDFVAGACD